MAKLVDPLATAWKVVEAELPVIVIGLVTVPIDVLEDVIGTWTDTPGRSDCWAETSNEPGTSTAGEIDTEVLAPTDALKLLVVRMNPEG